MARTHAIPASTLTLPSDTEILVERTFRAPRELVWRAFTDAALLPKWMGPARYTMTRSEMDVRPGGRYEWGWKLDEGSLRIHGVFTEVDAPRRLVTEEFMDPFPKPTRNTMTFTEKDGRTTVAIRIALASKEMRDAMLATGMQGGMDEGYDRLDALLPSLARPTLASTLSTPSDTEILLERTFRAPRALVWRAFTDPKLLPRWMGPAEHPMTRCEIDLRPGGKMIWGWGEDGQGYQMPAEFVEVDAPRRMVYVDTGPTPARVTVTFHEEKDGRTRVAFHARFPDKAGRDEILASGWTEGTEMGYVRLDALLPEMA